MSHQTKSIELGDKQERAILELRAIRTRVRRVLDAGERLDAATQELERDLATKPLRS